MASIFKKLNGVINNIFSIGLKENKTTFKSTAEDLLINKTINVGSNFVKSSATPLDVDNLVNLYYLNQRAKELYNSSTRVAYIKCHSPQTTFTFPLLFQNTDSIIIKKIIVDVVSECTDSTTLTINIADSGESLFSSTDSGISLSTIGQYSINKIAVLDSTSNSIDIIGSSDDIIDSIRIYIEYSPIYDITNNSYSADVLKNSEEFSY